MEVYLLILIALQFLKNLRPLHHFHSRLLNSFHLYPLSCIDFRSYSMSSSKLRLPSYLSLGFRFRILAFSTHPFVFPFNPSESSFLFSLMTLLWYTTIILHSFSVSSIPIFLDSKTSQSTQKRLLPSASPALLLCYYLFL